jgi:predicted ATPase
LGESRGWRYVCRAILSFYFILIFLSRIPYNGNQEIGYKLQIETSSGALVPSHLISDGVLLFLGYLTIVLGVYPVSVLLVEEPEIGIHPGLLKRVVGLLKDLSQGKYGPPVQVIVTTHSPLLLNYIEPSEIRVFQRGA